jgi:hypothetical protein
MNELRNRRVGNILIAVVDGLKRFPEAYIPSLRTFAGPAKAMPASASLAR